MPDLQGQLFGGAPGRKTYTEHGLPVTDIPQAKIKGGMAPFPTRTQTVGWNQDTFGNRRDIQRSEVINKYDSRPQEEQLKLFMKPTEILQKWGPLDADREDLDFQDIEYTGRSHDTRGNSNVPEMTWRQNGTNTDAGYYPKRTSGGSPVYARAQADVESDDELWSRKYDEAFDPYGRQGAEGIADWGEKVREPRNTFSSRDTLGNRNMTAGRTMVETWNNELGTHEVARKYYANAGDDPFKGHETLGDSIVSRGYQGKPIPLGLERRNINNQRELVGGHHRMAVMKEHRPDDYVPVEHFRDIHEAKSRGDYT